MMPQATDELRAEWDGPSDQKAIKFLQDAGYKLTPQWEWRHKDSNHMPTPKEISAVNFMFQEWDFGGFDPATPPHKDG
jgi:hypothetical protein